jgi:2-polyprenyl-6-methoxyphenol hydroxylase-like FAD-dependent oxidoreductase
VTAARTALIVGAGIAGMTAAGELARAGIEVDLIEREPEPVFHGIGILLLPPTVRCMRTLGLADACVERGFPQYDAATFSADGTLLARAPMAALAGPDLPPAIGIMRASFGDILRERAADAGVRLRWGTTVTALAAGDDGVHADLSDGTTARYDLVVGADGLRSRVRALLFPEHPPPVHIGQSIWRVRVGMRPPDLHGHRLFLGETTRAGFNAILPDDMYLYCLHQTDEGQPVPGRDASHALLMDILAGYGGLVAEVRDLLTPESPVHYGPLYTSFIAGPWHRGAAIVIGDAAHATPPHLASGAGLAIEDAIVLAECLREADSVTSAFAAFMGRRYERCRLVIEASRTLSRWDLDPDAPRHQAGPLMDATWAALSEPI